MLAIGAKNLFSSTAKGQRSSDSLTCWSRVVARSGHCPPASCAWLWSARSLLLWISSEKFVLAAWSSEGGEEVVIKNQDSARYFWMGLTVVSEDIVSIRIIPALCRCLR